jgi:hypothetical protein
MQSYGKGLTENGESDIDQEMGLLVLVVRGRMQEGGDVVGDMGGTGDVEVGKVGDKCSGGRGNEDPGMAIDA